MQAAVLELTIGILLLFGRMIKIKEIWVGT